MATIDDFRRFRRRTVSVLRHLQLRERLAIVHRSSIPRELPIRAAHREDSSNVSTRLFRVASSASPSADSGAFPFSFFSSLFAAAFPPTSSAAAGDSGSRRASVVASASCHCSIVTCASNMTIRARIAAVRAGLSPSPPPAASAAAAAAAGDSGSRRASFASVVASASCHFSDDTSASNWSIRDAREVVVAVVVAAVAAASAAAVPMNPSNAPATSREGAKSPSGATPNIASWARADAAAIASAVAAAI